MNICGISWLRENEYGTARLGLRSEHGGLRDLYRKLRNLEIITGALKDFGRFGPESKRVCLCAALALHDAALTTHSPETSETGLLVAGPEGAQDANLSYFRDYIAAGRSLGRGNLFIYTLPTSPAAETAIAFGLNGPLLYSGRGAGDGRSALQDAARLVAAGQARAMLCALINHSAVACYVIISKNRPDQPGLPLQDVLAANGETAPFEEPWEWSMFAKGWI